MLILLEFTYVKFICYFIFSYHRKKKAVKKPKLMEAVYLEQTESSSDNDLEFSDTSNKGVEIGGLSWQISKCINKVNNIFCYFCLGLLLQEKRDKDQNLMKIFYLKSKKCLRNVNHLNHHHMTYLLDVVRNLQMEDLPKKRNAI